MNNKFFPLFIDLKEKNILVVGAGNIAHRKIKTLLNYGAKIKVITKKIENEEIYFLKENKKIEILENREFNEKFLENIFLVIAATDNKELNRKIYEICNSKNILVNNVTSKNEMNVRFASIFENNECQIGISAYGNPKKSKEIKEKIKKMFKK